MTEDQAKNVGLTLAIDTYRANPERYNHLIPGMLPSRIVEMAETFESYLIGNKEEE